MQDSRNRKVVYIDSLLLGALQNERAFACELSYENEYETAYREWNLVIAVGQTYDEKAGKEIKQ